MEAAISYVNQGYHMLCVFEKPKCVQAVIKHMGSVTCCKPSRCRSI
jgi:hypothetical protein